MSHDSNLTQRPTRRFRRKSVDLQMGILLNGQFQFVRITELSEGGLLLRASEPCPIGTMLELCFFLPSGEFVMSLGEVAYHLQPFQKDYYLGIRFTQMFPHAQERVRRFIDHT